MIKVWLWLFNKRCQAVTVFLNMLFEECNDFLPAFPLILGNPKFAKGFLELFDRMAVGFGMDKLFCHHYTF